MYRPRISRAENKDLMNELRSDTYSASFSCFPLRSCPSSRSFTMWRTGILIMSTWRSLFCSFSQRMIPSIAPSTRWWVDTICGALLTLTHVALALRHSEVVWVPLTVTGTEEHHMVLWEVTDGDLPRQFAHPGGHPHHPVQHDSDEGRPARSRGGAGMFSEMWTCCICVFPSWAG